MIGHTPAPPHRRPHGRRACGGGAGHPPGRQAVGWKVRFTDQVNPDGTFVKLMTDGILLAEIQTDRELPRTTRSSSTRHQSRSLNIDFLLGYLAQLLPKRPDLKVVITSATIDPERFSAASATPRSSRSAAVRTRGGPLPSAPRRGGGDDANRPDQITAITDAVELQAEGEGDILVFLSGEREIRDTADALTKKNYRFTEVLPSTPASPRGAAPRLPAPHRPRIVLATNVATSLTVPGIKYVINRATPASPDTATAPRSSACPSSRSHRPAQAGARAVVADVVGRHLHPPVLPRTTSTPARSSRTRRSSRTNLASVILQMTAAGLGDIGEVPLHRPAGPPQHPRRRPDFLQELGALDPSQKGATPSASRTPAASSPSSP